MSDKMRLAVPPDDVMQAVREVLWPAAADDWLAEWNQPGWWDGGHGSDIDEMQQVRRDRMESDIMSAAYARRLCEEATRPASTSR